jgi:putative SOS response-associated peptidase YedK
LEMCRCYVSPDIASIEHNFGLTGTAWRFAANFNTTPSQIVPVVRAREGRTEIVPMRWGFAGRRSFNARVETLATGSAFRVPWKRGRRCIVPALGFYEWHVNPDASEQPYYIHPDDQDVFGFAGLWTRSRADANGVTESCSIITVPANPLMAKINNAGARMPAMLTRGQRKSWLTWSTESAGMTLSAYADERLLAYAVSDRINSPHNNDESLLEPLETDVD